MSPRQVSGADVATFLNENAWRYLEALRVLKDLLEEYAESDEGRDVVHSIYSRGNKQRGRSEFKDAWQVKLKVTRQREHGNPRFAVQDVNDIIGITVVCNYRGQVNLVERLLRRNADAGMLAVVDEEDKDELGYRARHLVVTLGERRYAGIQCEIQIKTVLHDAWTRWSHDLTYKPSGSIPGSLPERMSALSAQLSAVDLLTESFKADIDELWKRERKRKEACISALVDDVAGSLEPTTDQPETYRSLVKEAAKPRYRTGDCRRLLDQILGFEASYAHICWALAVLAARRESDDLDFVALDHIERLVLRSSTDEERVFAFTLKGLALFVFNKIPAAVEASESALESARSLERSAQTAEVAAAAAEAATTCMGNIATYLAELGNVSVERRARGLMDEVVAARGGVEQLEDNELDTLGLIKIIYGRTKAEVTDGKRLCRNAGSRKPADKTARAFSRMHVQLADEKLSQLPG